MNTSEFSWAKFSRISRYNNEKMEGLLGLYHMKTVKEFFYNFLLNFVLAYSFVFIYHHHAERHHFSSIHEEFL